MRTMTMSGKASKIYAGMVVLCLAAILPQQVIGDLFKEYLTGRVILSLLFDADRKLLWVGTDNNGLISFDGTRSIEFTPDNSGLAEISIPALALDHASPKNLWIGTLSRGANRFDIAKNEWTHFNASKGLVHDSVTSITVDNRGRIWFGTLNGAGLYTGDSWYRYTTTHYGRWTGTKWDTIKTYRPNEKHLLNNLIYSIAADSSGDLWFGTETGISRLNANAEWDTSISRPNQFGQLQRVQAVFVDRQNNKWFGTSDSIYTFPQINPKRQLVSVVPSCAQFSPPIYSMTSDVENNLWFGTLAGALRLDASRTIWRCATGSADLDGKDISAMAADEDGNIWFGSIGTPSVTKHTANWEPFSKTNTANLLSDRIFSMARDRSKQIWIGTSRGAACYDGKVWKSKLYFSPESNIGNRIAAIEVDSAGTLWLGSLGNNPSGVGGVININPDGSERNRHNFNNTAGRLLSNFVQAIAIGGKSILWFGTDKGVSRLNLATAQWDTFTVANTKQGLIDNFITALAVDLQGHLWCGTPSGASRYDGSNWKKFTTVDGLSNNGVSSITVDRKNGRVWFGTAGGGASSYRNGVWNSFTILDGLVDNNVQDVEIFNDRNEIWFATTDGVSCRDSSGQWTNFTTSDGLADNNVSEIQAGMQEGEVWFGTASSGTTRYRRQRFRPNTFILAPTEINGRPDFNFQITTQAIVLFSFFGTDLNTIRDELSYSYKLDDELWSNYTSDTFARVRVVKNGMHTFYVKAVDKDKNEDLSPASLSFYKVDPDTGITTTFIDKLGFPNLGDVKISLYWPPYQLADTAQITILPVHPDLMKSKPALLAYDFKPYQLNILKKGVILSFEWPSSSDQGFSIHRDLDSLGRQDNTILGGATLINKGYLKLTTRIDQLGRYAVRERLAADDTSRKRASAAITAQPRIFSPSGRGHGLQTNIAFKLDAPANVRIQAYNLAGRLVQTIWDEPLRAGVNAVPWNGKDRNGDICPSGLYIITLESKGFHSPPAPIKVMVVNQ